MLDFFLSWNHDGFGFTLNVAYAVMTALMIAGAFDERRVFLLPWLIYQLLDAVLNATLVVYMAVEFRTVLALLAVKAPVTLAFWAAVLAYYIDLRPHPPTAEKPLVIDC